MTAKKPGAVKFLNGLLIMRLVLGAILIIVFFFVKDITPGERSALGGIRDGIVSALDLDNSRPSFAFGYLIGKMIWPLLVILFMLMFIKERKYSHTFTAAILDVIIGLAQGAPLLSIISLIFIVTNPTRSYLKKVDKNSSGIGSQPPPGEDIL